MLKNNVVMLYSLTTFVSFLCVTVNAKEPISYSNNNFDDVLMSGKLLFAHVLFRHGDRTPINPYPNDPWSNRNFWSTGFGQLTNLGKQQHYELGQWLRKRYTTLLSAKYIRDEIYIQSTDVDRSLMSALANLAGLYKPTNEDIWNKDIQWQPIPVHTAPEQCDVLAAHKSCPAYDYAMSALQNSVEFQKLNERFQYLFDYLTEHSGRVIDSLQGIQRINNTLFIESIKNKTLPEWTKKVYPSTDMTYVSNLAFAIETYTRQMARLKIGPLIKEMLQRFHNKALGKLETNRTVWIYSAHDTTVASVLNTLKLFHLHSPPYTACIMLEMRLDNNKEPFVSIFYKNTTAEPKPMHIPDCGIACPLSKMFILYKDILPENWAEECKLSTMMMTYEEANIGLATGILVVIILILLFLSYVLMIYMRRRNYRDYSPYSQMT